MGWYFRKSVNVGPLRINASKSGIGASVGVQGLRVGAGPRGNYISMGRAGVYYRQSLSTKATRRSLSPPRATVSPFSVGIGIGAFQQIAAGDVAQMAPIASADLLAELTRVQSRVPRIWIAFGLTAVALIAAFQLGTGLQIVLFVTSVIVIMSAVLDDRRHGVARLVYDIEPSLAFQYDALRRGLSHMAECNLVRHTDAIANVYDAKRNAGATQTLRSNNIVPGEGRPGRVECNLRVPVIPAGIHTLYFFPDRLLVYESGRVGAIDYGDVGAVAGTTQFIEEESPPPDAAVVGQTWRFVNKNGGPDRRFNNNRQLPVMQYGTLEITGSGGLRHRFLCSQPTKAAIAAAAINASRRALHQP